MRTMDSLVKGILLLTCLVFTSWTEGAVIRNHHGHGSVKIQRNDDTSYLVPPIMFGDPRRMREGNVLAKIPPIRTPMGTPMKTPERRPERTPERTPTKHNIPQTDDHRVSVKPLDRLPTWRFSVRPERPLRSKDALLRQQEWASASGEQIDDKRLIGDGILSEVVHDPTMGERGVTVLKDADLNACFINHYFEPFVLPTPQRHFYANIMPATVVETADEQEQFRQCVGPVVANHCQYAKSYWLDEDLFFKFLGVHQDQNLRSRQSSSGKQNPTLPGTDIPLEPLLKNPVPKQVTPGPEMKIPVPHKVIPTPQKSIRVSNTKIPVPLWD